MIGVNVNKRNIRRQGVPATIDGQPNSEYGPTVERLLKSEGHNTIGDDKQGGKKYTMRDTPLDRAYAKKIITGAEHSALTKYRHHWWHAGQAPDLHSLDLNRIYAGGDSGPAGMPKSEGQVFHRQRWREAQTALGMRSAAIVDRFVCREENLEDCGFTMGYSSPYRARQAAVVIVCDAAYRLSRLWGIG